VGVRAGTAKVTEDQDVEQIDLDLEVESEAPLIANLLSEKSDQLAAFRQRSRVVRRQSVHKHEVDELLAKGWRIGRTGKRKTGLAKDKPEHEKLEDRAWCLLYRMGYDELNGTRFEIKFRRSTGSAGSKQIDVFACDSETAVIVECKSKVDRGRKSLQKDLSETAALQQYIRNSVFAHFGKRPKPKLIWLYVTSNIIWSEPDIDRARDAGIYVVTENELQYFETFLKHMGPAGRYQILGEFLKGQRIPALVGNKVPAIRGTLGGQTFYSFVTTPRDLLKISFINHQALNHPDGRPAYQRMVSAKRIKDIGEFISKKGGFFPTNLLINFMQSPRFDPISNKENTDPNIKFGWLTLPAIYRSAWVIDGQHRLYGYSGLTDEFLNQSLLVLAFDHMETYKEADLFITINHKQKSVPPGLLVTLLADLRMGDPDPKTALSALASSVVRRINIDKTSPLNQRFATPDVAAGPHQNLTISEAVNGLNRSGLLGKIIHGSIVPGPLCGATDDATIDRARRILNGYFDALRTANPVRWEAGKSAYMCVNPAIRAHLMLIPEIIAYIVHKRTIDFVTLSEEKFIMELARVAAPIFDFFNTSSDEEVKRDYSRKFGEGGVKEYLYNLCGLIIGKFPEFGSEEFRRYVDQKASDEVDDANRLIMKLSENMIDCVVKVLKSRYGEHRRASGEPAYWELGVTSRRVQENAYKKQLEEVSNRRKPKEAYLDILDLKDIIEQENNWLFFEPIFNVPMPGERKGSKKFHTGWIAKFNEIRKIAAHKNALRTYSEDDLEFVDWLRTEVAPGIEQELARE
jgi:DNA sulfur modification protein DndB